MSSGSSPLAKVFAVALSFSLCVSSIGPLPPASAQEGRDDPFAPRAFAEASFQSRSYTPSLLDDLSQKQQSFIDYQNFRHQKGEPLDSGVLDELVRQNSIDKFLTQEGMDDEARRRQGKLHAALRAQGLRYKKYADGRTVWFKAGRIQRIENERFQDKSGRVRHRDTVDMRYDARGNLISYKTETRDAQGQMETRAWTGQFVSREDGKDLLSRSVETRRDALGRETTAERFEIEYDERGRTVGYRENVSDPDGGRTSRAVSDSQYDHEDRVTSYTETITRPDGTQTDRTWGGASYDDDDRLIAYTEHVREAPGRETRNDWSGDYDAKGRLSSYRQISERPDGSKEYRHWQKAQYDENGNLSGYEETVKDDNGNESRIMWKDGRYDPLGRLLSYREKRTENGVISYRIREGTEFNFNGETVAYREIGIDAFGNRTVKDWEASSYDKGRLTGFRETTTDVQGRQTLKEWTGTYDAAGRLSGFRETVDSSEGEPVWRQRRGIVYDATGRVIAYEETAKDRKGETRRTWRALSFDAQDRVSGFEERTVGPSGESRRLWENGQHDNQGRLRGYDETLFDAEGRATRRRWRAGSYDRFGRLTAYSETVVNPLGDTFDISRQDIRHDSLGRLAFFEERTISHPSPSTGESAFSLASPLPEERSGGEIVRTWQANSFDNADRVTSYREKTVSHEGKFVKDWSGTYGNGGLLLSSSETLRRPDGVTVEQELTFAVYDSVGRLTDSARTVRHSDQPAVTREITITNRRYDNYGVAIAGAEQTRIVGHLPSPRRFPFPLVGEDDRKGHAVDLTITRTLQNAVLQDGRAVSYTETTETRGQDDRGRAVHLSEETQIQIQGRETRETTRRRAYADDGTLLTDTTRHLTRSNEIRDTEGRLLSCNETSVGPTNDRTVTHRRNFYSAAGSLIQYSEDSESFPSSRKEGEGDGGPGEGLEPIRTKRLVSNFAYDPDGHVIHSREIIVKPGRKTSVQTIEKNGLAYDLMGRLIAANETVKSLAGGNQDETRSTRNFAYDSAGRLESLFEKETTSRTAKEGIQTNTTYRLRENIRYPAGSPTPWTGQDGVIVQPDLATSYEETTWIDSSPKSVSRTLVSNIRYDSSGRQVSFDSATMAANMSEIDKSLAEKSLKGPPPPRVGERVFTPIFQSLEQAAAGKPLEPLDVDSAAPLPGLSFTRRVDTVYDNNGRAVSWKELSASVAAPARLVESEVSVTYEGDTGRFETYSARTREGTTIHHLFRDNFTYDSLDRPTTYRESTFPGDNVPVIPALVGIPSDLQSKGIDWQTLSSQDRRLFLNDIFNNRVEVLGKVQFQLFKHIEYDDSGRRTATFGETITRGNALADFDTGSFMNQPISDLKKHATGALQQEADYRMIAAESALSAGESRLKSAESNLNTARQALDVAMMRVREAEAPVARLEEEVRAYQDRIAAHSSALHAFRGQDVFYSRFPGNKFKRIRIDESGDWYLETGRLGGQGEPDRVVTGTEKIASYHDGSERRDVDAKVSNILSYTQLGYTAVTNQVAREVRARHNAETHLTMVLERDLGSARAVLASQQEQADSIRRVVTEKEKELEIVREQWEQARGEFETTSASIEKERKEQTDRTMRDIEGLLRQAARTLTGTNLFFKGQTHTLTEADASALAKGEAVSVFGKQRTLAQLSEIAEVKCSLNTTSQFARFDLDSSEGGSHLAWQGSLSVNGRPWDASSGWAALHAAIEDPKSNLSLISDGSLTLSRTLARAEDIAGRTSTETLEVTEILRAGNQTSSRSYTQETTGYRYDSQGRVIGYTRTTTPSASGEEGVGEAGNKITTESLLNATYDSHGRLLSSHARVQESTFLPLKGEEGSPNETYELSVTNRSFDQAGRVLRATRVREQNGRISVEQDFEDRRYDSQGRVLFSATDALGTSPEEWSAAVGDFKSAAGEKTRTTVWNHAFDYLNNPTSLTRLTLKETLSHQSSSLSPAFHSTLESTTQSFDSTGRLHKSASTVRELGQDANTGFLFKSYQTDLEVTKYSSRGHILRQKRSTRNVAGSHTEEDLSDRVYDVQGRLIATHTRQTDSTDSVTVTRWKALKFDKAGRVLRFDRISFATQNGNQSDVGFQSPLTEEEAWGVREFSLTDTLYDSQGRLLDESTRTEHIFNGAVSRSFDQTRRILKYDAFGRVHHSEIIHRDGADHRRENRVTNYDSQGRAVRTVSEVTDLQTGRARSSSREIFSFDQEGRAIRTRDTVIRDGLTSERVSLEDIRYDSRGRVQFQRDVLRERGPGLDKVTEETLSDIRYDDRDRRTAYTRIVDDGAFRATEKVSDIAYDPSDRIVSMTTDLAESSLDPALSLFHQSTIHQKDMRYDEHGNLIDYKKTVTDGSLVTVYRPVLLEYDDQGRPISRLEHVRDNAGRDQISGSLDIVYNQLGQVLSARQVTINGRSDALAPFLSPASARKVDPRAGEGAGGVAHLISFLLNGSFERQGAGELVRKFGLDHVVINNVLENRYDTQGRLVYTRTSTDEAAWDREGRENGTLTLNTRAEAEAHKRELEQAGYSVEMSVERIAVHMSERRRGRRGHNEWTEVVDGKATLTFSREVSERHCVETTTETVLFDSLNRAALQIVSTKDGSARTVESRFLSYNAMGQTGSISRYVDESGRNGDGTSYSKSFAQQQSFAYDSLNRISSETTRTYGDTAAPSRETIVTRDNIRYNSSGQREAWTETSWSNAAPARAEIKVVTNATYNSSGQLVGSDEDVYEVPSPTGVGEGGRRPGEGISQAVQWAIANRQSAMEKRLLYSDRNIRHHYDSRGRLLSTTFTRLWGTEAQSVIAREARQSSISLTREAGEGGQRPGEGAESGGIQGLDDNWTSGRAKITTVYAYNADSTSMSRLKVTAEGAGAHTNKAVEAQGIRLSYEQKDIRYNEKGQRTSYRQSVTQVEHYQWTESRKNKMGTRKKNKAKEAVGLNTTETTVTAIENDALGRQTFSRSSSYNHGGRAWTNSWTRVHSFDDAGRAKDIETWSETNIKTGVGSAMITGNHVKETRFYDASGRLDPSRIQRTTLNSWQKAYDRSGFTKSMQVVDITVAVAAVVVAVVATVTAVVTAGAAAPTAAAAWKTAALCVTMAAAGYRTSRTGISTHDLEIAGREQDRASARQNTMSFYSNLASVLTAGAGHAMSNTQGVLATGGQLTATGRTALATVHVASQMGATAAGGADAKTLWTVGILTTASSILSGGSTAGTYGGGMTWTHGSVVIVGTLGQQLGMTYGNEKQRSIWTILGSAVSASAGGMARAATSALKSYAIQQYVRANEGSGRIDRDRLRRGMVTSALGELFGNLISYGMQKVEAVVRAEKVEKIAAKMGLTMEEYHLTQVSRAAENVLRKKLGLAHATLDSFGNDHIPVVGETSAGKGDFKTGVIVSEARRTGNSSSPALAGEDARRAGEGGEKPIAPKSLFEQLKPIFQQTPTTPTLMGLRPFKVQGYLVGELYVSAAIAMDSLTDATVIGNDARIATEVPRKPALHLELTGTKQQGFWAKTAAVVKDIVSIAIKIPFALYHVARKPESLFHAVRTVKNVIFGDIATLVSGDFLDKQKLAEDGRYLFDQDPSKVNAISINGVMNTKADAEVMKEAVAEGFGVQDMTRIANGTRGPLDFVQVFFHELGSYDKAVRNTLEAIRQAIYEKGEAYVVAHSQGTAIFGTALELLTAEERRKIHYYGAGSQFFVDAEVWGLASARNVWNKGDKVPWGNSLNPLNMAMPGRASRMFRERVKEGGGRTSWRVIEGEGNGFNKHGFMQFYAEDMKGWAGEKATDFKRRRTEAINGKKTDFTSGERRSVGGLRAGERRFEQRSDLRSHDRQGIQDENRNRGIQFWGPKKETVNRQDWERLPEPGEDQTSFSNQIPGRHHLGDSARRVAVQNNSGATGRVHWNEFHPVLSGNNQVLRAGVDGQDSLRGSPGNGRNASQFQTGIRGGVAVESLNSVLTAVRSDPSEFSQGPDQSTSQKIQQALQPFFVQKDGKMVFDPKALTFYDQEMGAKYEVMSRQAQTWRTQADQMTDPTLKQAYTKMAEAAEKKIDPAFKRFNEVKAWMAKTDLRTIANNTASGACNAIAYYLLAASAGKETRTFQQFFTDELRHGNISLGHIQRREGGRTITVTGAFKATGSGNWDKKYRIHREANLSQAQRNLGNNEITFAIVYYDTGRKPDGYPDHFFIIQKNSRGEWINQDHASSNPARRGGATDWNRVYEVRYIR